MQYSCKESLCQYSYASLTFKIFFEIGTRISILRNFTAALLLGYIFVRLLKKVVTSIFINNI